MVKFPVQKIKHSVKELALKEKTNGKELLLKFEIKNSQCANISGRSTASNCRVNFWEGRSQ